GVGVRQQVGARAVVQPVKYVAAFAHQRHNMKRIKHIHRNNNVSVVTLLEYVGVAVRELGQQPRLAELLRRLIAVGVVEYRGIRRVRGFSAYSVTGQLGQLERQLSDVAADAAQACVQRGVAQQVAALLLFVHLPRAGKGLMHTKPATSTRLVSFGLASEAEHAQASAFKSRRLYARFFLPAFFAAVFFAAGSTSSGASFKPLCHGLGGPFSCTGAGTSTFFALRLSVYSCLPAVTSACASGSGTVAVRPVARSRIVQCFIVDS